MKKRGKLVWFIACFTALIIGTVLIKYISSRDSYVERENEQEIETVEMIYGIPYQHYTLDDGVVASGQTISTIFAKYGVGAAMVDRIARKAEGVFNLRNIRAGHNYTAFLKSDTTAQLTHFVYEQSITEYVVITINGDSIEIKKEEKEVSIKRCTNSAVISSSLWNSMVDKGMTPALAMDLSDIYAWSIDFFGLQEGDNFTVIYDEKFVDTTSIGAGRIWGAIFNHAGKDYYAIPFIQDGKFTYWDEQGNSLRKNLLKAPLKFSRISSRFSNSRLHPILKIRRPHLGVDYVAPSGTPVVAVADGVVTYKGYSGGGGNTVKIKHASTLSSGYLHLRSFGKGIAVGKRVNQGDVIGHVGTTGLSTGPHLDFRLWKGSQAIDPLKVPAEPTEPITAANKANFEIVKQRIIAELNGEIADSLKITQLDSIVQINILTVEDNKANSKR